MIHDDIDDLLKECISIIKDEIHSIADVKPLKKADADKLIEYAKTLVVIRRDWRQAEKENTTETKSLTNEELDAAILAEAEKIKRK